MSFVREGDVGRGFDGGGRGGGAWSVLSGY